MKRFQFHAFGGGKINSDVEFSTKLDLSNFVSTTKENQVQKQLGLTYSLYAVVVHYGGSLHAGHYVAFVKSSGKGWYCMDDSHVSQVSEKQVLAQKAYMLFYLRDQPVFAPSAGPSLTNAAGMFLFLYFYVSTMCFFVNYGFSCLKNHSNLLLCHPSFFFSPLFSKL